MTHHLTLIASDRPLNPAWTATIFADHLAGPVTWLRPDYAARAPLPHALNPNQMAALRARAAPHRVDVFCTKTPRAPYRLMLADMDSTMIIGETLDDLSGLVGVRDQVAPLTAAAMNGSMDYRAATIQRLALLRGTGPAILNQVRDDIRYAPGGATLVATLRAQGVKTVLVSGGFTLFVGPAARALGFDDYYGNTLDLDATGTVTGQIRDPLVHHARKREILLEISTALGTGPDQAMAIGDGANDVPMIETAGLGVGYHPKPIVAEKIPNLLLYGDLTALLYAGGYNYDQFIPTPDPTATPAHDPKARAQI